MLYNRCLESQAQFLSCRLLSLNLHTVILADPKLCAGAKVVAGTLLFLFHNTKSGQCFPTNATVGDVVGMHAKTVSKHISGLVRAGYVFRDPRYNNSSITDFNWVKGGDEAVKAVWARVKEARDGAKSRRGSGTESRWGIHEMEEGMEPNGGVDIHGIVTLTRESNSRGFWPMSTVGR